LIEVSAANIRASTQHDATLKRLDPMQSRASAIFGG
jgi:hypothetical protein